MVNTEINEQIDWISRLVAFDTISAKSNLDLIAFVEDYLQAHGIASDRVTSADGAKANLDNLVIGTHFVDAEGNGRSGPIAEIFVAENLTK